MRHHLRALAIVGLTIGLMLFFFRNADPRQVWSVILEAHLNPLLLAMILSVGTYIIRIERWRCLLLPLGRAAFGSAGRATVIGFAANALLPGRVGEVLRPYVLSTHEPVSASAAFATIVIERLLDLLAVVLVVAVLVPLLHSPSPDPGLLATLQTGAAAAALGGVVASLAVLWLARHPRRAEAMAARLSRVLPHAAGRAVTTLFQRFLVGLAVMQRPATLVLAMVLSVALWVGIALSIWAASAAFDIDVSFAGGVVLMGLVAIGVSVPTPAGAGGYHAAYQLGVTSLYGAGQDQAVAAALVNHLIAFGPVTLLGLVFMAQEGMRLSRVFGLGTEGDAPGRFRTGQSGVPHPVTDDDGGAS